MRSSAAKGIVFGLLGAMILSSLVLGEFWTTFFARSVTWMFLAVSFTIAYSFARIPSLAQATIFAIGAYTTVWLAPALQGNVLMLLLASFAGATLSAWVLGLLVFQMTLPGAAIATIIVSVIGYVLGNAAVPITGGADGLALPRIGYSLLGFSVSAGPTKVMLFLGTSLLTLLLCAMRLLERTHAWIVVRAVQQNATRARVLGYNVSLYRLVVFSVSGGIAGLGGALYALVALHVTADLMSLLMSFKAILWAVVGGIGTVFGGPVGVLIVQVATELISRWTVRVDMMIGILLILSALALPHGLMGLVGDAERRSRERKSSSEAAKGKKEAFTA